MNPGASKPWQRIDPRLHLGAAIGWIIFIVVSLFAFSAGLFAASEAEDQVSVDSERALSEFASGIAHALTITLETHLEVIRTTAERIGALDRLAGPPLEQQLDAIERHFAAFRWLGVADQKGKIVAATGDLRLGEDVSASPAFQQALTVPAVSPAFTAPAPRDPPGLRSNQAAVRAIELAVRLQDHTGHATGVLLVALSWNWLEQRKDGLLSALGEQHHRALDSLLVSGNGTVLSGPPLWLGRKLAVDTDLTEDGTYLVGRTMGGTEKVGLTDWTVIVRQPSAVAVALAQTNSVGRTAFLSVLVAGLLSAAIAIGFVRVLIRRLERLAGQARSLQKDTSGQLTVPAGRDEISHVGAVLAELVDQLQREKKMLERLNIELDQRVAVRTARIERLAEDARHAAVTRERLRIARDLHDTLAHSMMALLTQIRLVRKLRRRWSDGDLDAELAQAEAVAISGLAESRAAIGQMRYNGVREVGLGPALQALLARFRERTGLVAMLHVEPSAGTLADERAETAFRIVEEALRNVECHAQAKNVTVNVESIALPDASQADHGRTQRIRLEVADDGIGFDPAERPHGHYGLRGMDEQAALIEAQLTVACAPGKGTRVVLEFDA